MVVGLVVLVKLAECVFMYGYRYTIILFYIVNGLESRVILLKNRVQAEVMESACKKEFHRAI